MVRIARARAPEEFLKLDNLALQRRQLLGDAFECSLEFRQPVLGAFMERREELAGAGIQATGVQCRSGIVYRLQKFRQEEFHYAGHPERRPFEDLPVLPQEISIFPEMNIRLGNFCAPRQRYSA